MELQLSAVGKVVLFVIAAPLPIVNPLSSASIFLRTWPGYSSQRTSIFLRLSSFILLCIGVQIFWNGASALLGSLAHDTHKQIPH